VGYKGASKIMELIIQLYANNEIRCKVQTEAVCQAQPKDKAEAREAARRAVLREEYADIRRTTLHCFSKPIGYQYHEDAIAYQLSCFGERTPVAFETRRTPIYPKEVTVAEVDGLGCATLSTLNIDTLEARAATLLDITKKSQRPPSHASWGKAQRPKAFGSNARHRILESGAVIDRAKPRNSTYELTLTLPGGTPEAIKAVADWSGWIVNRQLQSIRRIEKSIRPWWFFVWEFQKRGALHQHWCIAADTPEMAYNTAMEIKQIWYKCLHELLDKAGVDCYARKGFGTWRESPKRWQWHCQAIKKSVAAYFSKYTSKEGANVRREKRYTRIGKIHYPSRWWGSSAEVKLGVKQWRVSAKISGLSREVAEALRVKALTYTQGLQITRQYQYEFDIKGEAFHDRSQNKSRRTSYCFGNVWILYVGPDTYPDIHLQFRDILGSAEERAAGTTILQALASDMTSNMGERLEYMPFPFGRCAYSLP
jgi:hypothetical protein